MRVREAILIGTASALTLANASHAQSQPIDIPAEDLRAALDAYIATTGVQLVYSVEDVKGKRSHEVHGVLSADDALNQLLEGSGVHVNRDSTGAVIVSQFENPPTDKAPAPVSGVETVTVTGSRVITSIEDSPTPLLSLSTKDLGATTPSDLADGLNKLPLFIGSRNQRSTGGPTADWPANFLNLRYFGSNRTLILLDGLRVPATDSSNDVDINTIPQAFVQRVDVVTGGASAVYGSDAVTGAVNFVLDHDYDGLKLEAQTGISTYGDDASWKLGVTAGTELLNGSAHIEASYEHYDSGGIDTMMTRPLGSAIYQELGAGTAADPYYRAADVRNVDLTPGGYISSGPLAGQYFSANGVLSPFVHGLPGNGVNEIGGDGGYAGEGYYLFPGAPSNPWLMASLKTDQWFARLDSDLSSSVHVFAQGNVSQSSNYNVSFVQSFSAQFAADNAFLPAAAQAALTSGGTQSFTLSRALDDEPGSISAGYTNNVNATVGADGILPGGFNWSIHFTHGVTQLHESSPDTLNMQRLYAALDAVTDPATGQIVCRVSLTPGGAAAYPGCVPFDAFGPNAESAAAFAYVTDTTSYKTTNAMSDFGASLSGTIAVLPAGPLNAALSMEYRDISLKTASAFSPTAKVDCTWQNPLTCNSSSPVWNGVYANAPLSSENVGEAAVEADIPVIHDLPLVRLFHLNLAARYAQYSISGPATTWKLGGVWDVTDDFKIRATQSRDFRAPTLGNLFAPANANQTAFTDYLTGISNNTVVMFQANLALKPEVAKTNTLGFIFRPGWLAGFTMSADWYDIRIHNVITSINGGTQAAEQACIASGGTSIYCSLVVRPHPITDTSPDNYPTEVISEAFNNGLMTTHGIDAQIDYEFALDDVLSGAPGQLATRLLLSYQPSLLSTTGIPGAVTTNQAGAAGNNGFSVPAGRVTLALDYTVDAAEVNLLERWHSSERNNEDPTLYFSDPSVPQVFYTDIALLYRFALCCGGDKDSEAFLTIENLFNQQPTPYVGIGRTGAEGYAYPASFDEDVVGRYFTIGIRHHF
jgi:iron complex outermembrane recepter protein